MAINLVKIFCAIIYIFYMYHNVFEMNYNVKLQVVVKGWLNIAAYRYLSAPEKCPSLFSLKESDFLFLMSAAFPMEPH